MSHTRPSHPALRVGREVFTEHLVSEILLEETKRTHVVVGDHAPEPRVVHEPIKMIDYGPGLLAPLTQTEVAFLERNRWRL